jgi:hypothetical protein
MVAKKRMRNPQKYIIDSTHLDVTRRMVQQPLAQAELPPLDPHAIAQAFLEEQNLLADLQQGVPAWQERGV